MSKALSRSLAVCAAITLLLLAFTLQRVAERGRFTRAFSSYGSGPEGARALYLLSAELGFRPQHWSQDLARLPPKAALVALGDCATGMVRPISRYERAELTRWVATGGTLFVAGSPHYLPAGFGVEFEPDPSCPDPSAAGSAALRAAQDKQAASDAGTQDAAPARSAEPPDAAAGDVIAAVPIADGGRDAGTTPDQAGASSEAATDQEPEDPDAPVWGVPMDAVLRGMPIVPFRDPGRLKLSSDAAADMLLAVPQHDPVSSTSSLLPLAVTVRYGQGRVVVLASANMLQNAELEDSEGAALFARLVRAYSPNGPVLFDEYHMGLGERRSLMQYLRQLGVMPGVFQLVLCVLVLLWRGGARFGGIRAPVATAPLGTTSFVTALAGLYQGAGDATAAVRLIARAALHRIAIHHGIGTLQSSALERTLAERGAADASLAVRSIVAAVSSTRSQPLPAIIQSIDAAVAIANSPPDAKSAEAASGRAGVFGWLPVRRR